MADVAAALGAYLHLIARLGASAKVVRERRTLLRRLLAYLGQVPRTAEAYQAQAATFVDDCRPSERVLAMTCAREFYYFWLDEMKRVVEITSRSGFSIDNLAFPQAGTLDALLDLMREQQFSRFPPSLGLFLGKLFEDGRPDEEIHKREILLKALLFLLERQPFRSTSYRMAVDALLLLLPDHDDKQLLLRTVREYFSYWQSFPFAHQRLNAASPDGESDACDE